MDIPASFNPLTLLVGGGGDFLKRREGILLSGPPVTKLRSHCGKVEYRLHSEQLVTRSKIWVYQLPPVYERKKIKIRALNRVLTFVAETIVSSVFNFRDTV